MRVSPIRAASVALVYTRTPRWEIHRLVAGRTGTRSPQTGAGRLVTVMLGAGFFSTSFTAGGFFTGAATSWRLPPCHQPSPAVIAINGKAHAK